MAVTSRYFNEFGKHTFQHITAVSNCGGTYARVYCGRSLEYYDSELVFPEIRWYPTQRPPMGGSQKTMFFHRDFPKTLQQRSGRHAEWKNREKSGGRSMGFWGTGRWKFFFDPQYLENGRGDFCEIFSVCGSHGALSKFWTGSWWGLKFRGQRGAKLPKMALRIAGWSLSTGIWNFAP